LAFIRHEIISVDPGDESDATAPPILPKQRQTNSKQSQNDVLFQTLLHVKQNTETIPRRFRFVLDLFCVVLFQL